MHPTFELLIAVFVFGLIIGSFISMLSWRLPRLMDELPENQLKNISLTRSQCPKCHTNLNWKQLIPLFSWLAYRGKCGHCQNPISIRYPLIELFTALVTVLSIWQFGLTPEGYLALLFCWFLITITVIDIEHYLILDKLSLPLMWIGLMINTQSIYTSPEQAIFGAVLGYLLLWLIFHLFKIFTGKEGMGFGDFKLLAALGAWFGAASIPQIILVASIGSIVIAILLAITKVRDINHPIPFGPYLALGGISMMFFGNLF